MEGRLSLGVRDQRIVFPEGWGPKFRAVFCSLPQEISFLLLSGGFLVEFWWFEAPGLKCARLEFSGCVKPRQPAEREERKKFPGKRAKFWAIQGKGPAEGGPGGEAQKS